MERAVYDITTTDVVVVNNVIPTGGKVLNDVVGRISVQKNQAIADILAGNEGFKEEEGVDNCLPDYKFVPDENQMDDIDVTQTLAVCLEKSDSGDQIELTVIPERYDCQVISMVVLGLLSVIWRAFDEKQVEHVVPHMQSWVAETREYLLKLGPVLRHYETTEVPAITEVPPHKHDVSRIYHEEDDFMDANGHRFTEIYPAEFMATLHMLSHRGSCRPGVAALHRAAIRRTGPEEYSVIFAPKANTLVLVGAQLSAGVRTLEDLLQAQVGLIQSLQALRSFFVILLGAAKEMMLNHEYHGTHPLGLSTRALLVTSEKGTIDTTVDFFARPPLARKEQYRDPQNTMNEKSLKVLSEERAKQRDVFGFGVVLLDVLTHVDPDLIDAVLGLQVLVTLQRACCQRVAGDRPHFREIVQTLSNLRHLFVLANVGGA